MDEGKGPVNPTASPISGIATDGHNSTAERSWVRKLWLWDAAYCAGLGVLIASRRASAAKLVGLNEARVGRVGDASLAWGLGLLAIESYDDAHWILRSSGLSWINMAAGSGLGLLAVTLPRAGTVGRIGLGVIGSNVVGFGYAQRVSVPKRESRNKVN